MISELVIRGFRGIPEELRLHLGRVTLLSGRNGLGKSTVFDAIDWCLFGGAWRLGDTNEALRSLYRPDIEPYVGVVIEVDDAQMHIERTPAGATRNGEWQDDREVVVSLIRDPDLFPPYTRDLAQRLRRLVYLPQEEIRNLISTASATERAGLLRALLGVPNAAVVHSSIRRVTERILEKRRDLEARLQTVLNDIEGTETESKQFGDSASVQDASAVTQEAKAILGRAAETAQSLDALQSLYRAELQSLAARRRAIEELLATVVEAESLRQGFVQDLDVSERALADLESRLLSGEAALQQARVRRTEAEAQATSLEAEVAAAMADAEKAARRIRQRQELRDLRDSLSAHLAAAARAEEAARSAEERFLAARDNLSLAVRHLGEQRIQLTSLREAEGRREERRRAAERHTTLVSELDAATAESRLLGEREAAAQERITLLKQKRTDVEDRYQRAMALASKRTRLLSLLSEAARLIGELDVATCPLCGREYRTSADLMSHIHSMGGRARVQPDSLDILQNEKERAAIDLSEAEKQLGQVKNRVREAQSVIDRITAEVTQLNQSLDDAAANADSVLLEQLPQVEEEAQRAALRAGDAERGRDHAQAALGSADEQLRRARDVLAVTQARVAALSDASASETDAGALEHLQSRLQKSREGAEQLRRQRDGVLDQLSQMAGAERRAQHEVNELRQKAHSLRADVAATKERIAAIERDATARVAHNLTTRSRGTSAEIRSEIEEVRAREARCREAWASLDALVMNERSRAASRQLGELRHAESAIRQDLATLVKAQGRFNEVARVVEARSNSEAQISAQRLKGAIQECLTALYPHRHLDQIELSLPEPDILLTDGYLARAVEPYLYASTGQLNVLALALFVAASLRQRVSKVDFMMLDEPVQNLDDIHFLAFISLVKRVALTRQVIFSTADGNIAELFRRQMKSAAVADGQYVQYEWRSFDPKSGPDIIRVDSLARHMSRRTTQNTETNQ